MPVYQVWGRRKTYWGEKELLIETEDEEEAKETKRDTESPKFVVWIQPIRGPEKESTEEWARDTESIPD